MTDSLELSSMDQETNLFKEDMYTDVRYVQLPDEQGGVYDQGQISYDTLKMASSQIVINDSYLGLPVQVGHDQDKKIAVKNSVLSLIHGLTVVASETTVVQETMSTPIVAELRLLLDSTIDFHDSNELMFFGKDQKIRGSVRSTPLSEVGGVLSRSSGGQADIDPFHNPALASRISVFDVRANDQVVGNVTINNIVYPASRTLVAYIPLKYIHDLFAVMSFPISNLSMKITLNLAGMAGYTQYCPWTCPTFAAHRTLGDPDATSALTIAAPSSNTPTDIATAVNNGLRDTLAPAVTASQKPGARIPLGGTAQERNTQFSMKPSLWLKVVSFNADTAVKMAAKITAGYDIKRVFRISQHYPSVQLDPHISQQISATVTRPTRLWAFPLPTGTLASEKNTFPAHIGPNGLRNVNIQTANGAIYQKPFTSQYELFREFKTQLISGNSMMQCATPISYTDWLLGCNPYCFDLSRNPIVQSNMPIQLTLEADAFTLSDGVQLSGAYDLCVVVERLRTIVFHVSAGGVSVIMRDGADV